MKQFAYFAGLFIFVFLLSVTLILAQEQKVCCSETITGEHCQYTEQSNCEPGTIQATTSCEQTSFCKLGCGFDQDDGKCFKNTPKFTCDNKEGCNWVESASCDIPQCQRGCCVLSNECSFITQLECKKTTSQFEDIDMTFKEEIDTELACINQCRSFERGACVSPDGSCTFTTRESCPEKTVDTLNVTGARVGFHKDRLCSNPQLGTECASQQTTGCLPDRDEVYWFDSCGNPENIYSSDKAGSYNNGFILAKEDSCNPTGDNVGSTTCGNCNYVQGSLCAQRTADDPIPSFGNYLCTDLTCEDLTVSPTTPSVTSEDVTMDNGESWCAYDALVGSGQDTVGSRHYRRLCFNGVELTEPCTDFREELCVQGIQDESPFVTEESFTLSDGSFLQGACRTNRWQGCFEIDNLDDCENLQQRDCFWIGPVTAPRNEREENEYKGNKFKGLGYCFPTVPPGIKFWPDESTGETPGTDATSVCEQGNQKCTVVYEQGGISGSKKCISNCNCESKSWLLSVNNQCKSLGDCGAYVNFLGEGTTDALTVTPNFNFGALTKKDLNDFKTLVRPHKGKGNFDNKFSAFFERSFVPLAFSTILGGATSLTSLYGGVGGTFFRGATANVFFPKFFALGKTTMASSAARAFGATPWDKLSGPVQDTLLKEAVTDEMRDQATGLVEENFRGKIQEEVAKRSAETWAGTIGPVNEPVIREAVTQEFIDREAKNLAKEGAQAAYESAPTQAAWGNTFATTLQYINTAMLIWTIYNVLEVFLADTDEETYSIECKPWVAPTGGTNCEACQEDGKECSEYRCKSLGQLCALVNQGTSDELCISSHPNDVSSPIITADQRALSRGLTLTEQAGQGFSVTPDLEPFTAITLGIATNEPSQCKYSINNSVAYEQMTTFFGDGLFRYAHNITFSLPGALTDEQILKITNGGKFTTFVKCQDGNGNANEKDYYIKFAVKKGPDLTAPVIELTSIENGAFVPSGTNETLLSIFLNEPSECKWDDIDNAFDSMPNEFSCDTSEVPTSSIFFGLYECSTLLDNIQDNQENAYFFKCKDQPFAPEEERNLNAESFVYTLKGTVPLDITSVLPEAGSELFTPSPVLKVVTSRGAQSGTAVCGYNFFDPNPLSAIDFLNTNATLHEQPFTNLTAGDYTVYITCIDAAGNLAQEETDFSISVDDTGPQLAQIYTEGTLLVLVITEASTCEYSTTGFFEFGTGIQMTGVNTEVHEASLESDLFYVVCQDTFTNQASFTVYV